MIFIFICLYFLYFVYSLTKLCLKGSYSVSKGAAMDPHPQVIPPTPSGYPYQKGHIGSLMRTWFPQLKYLTKVPQKITDSPSKLA